FLGGIFLGSCVTFAQGVSQIKVDRIDVSPASFRAGTALTVSIAIKAPPTNATGAIRAYANFFKANASGRLTYLADDYLGGVHQNEPALTAGQTRPVTFTQTFAVPSPSTGTIFLVAGAYDPP